MEERKINIKYLPRLKIWVCRMKEPTECSINQSQSLSLTHTHTPALPDMKVYHKASMSKKIWYCLWLDRESNGTEEKIWKYENVVYVKVISQISREKMRFKEKMVSVHEVVTEKKIKLDLFLTPKPKINTKQIRGLKWNRVSIQNKTWWISSYWKSEENISYYDSLSRSN